MTPLKPVEVFTSPDSKYQDVQVKTPETKTPKTKGEYIDVVWKKEETPAVNMVTKKVRTKDGEEYDFETLEKFKSETGKRPLYAGKVTKAFREWLDQKHA